MNSIPTTETCVLVAEIMGGSPLLEKLGAVETARAIERCRNRAERSIDAYQGFLVQTDGAYLTAHFPRSENAVLAAFDMRARVSQLPPVSGVALSIHIALHRCQIDPATKGPAQIAVSLTKQLATIAPAGQILVSEEIARVLPENIQSQLEVIDAPRLSANAYKGRLHVVASGAAPNISAETYSPTATSLSIEQESFDSTSQSQPPAFGAAATLTPRSSLMLRHNKSNLLVSEGHPVVLAGREEGNDLVIADRRASRHHSRIEWRQSRFLLIDTSTNGTFLVDDAGNEVVLRRGEAELPLRGRIGFGYSPQEVGAEVVFFDLGHR